MLYFAMLDVDCHGYGENVGYFADWLQS